MGRMCIGNNKDRAGATSESSVGAQDSLPTATSKR
jgi:hypothetical protein